MTGVKGYLFTSDRLGFRNWTREDRDAFGEMNADPEVMRYFPEALDRQASEKLLLHLTDHFNERGYTYFATDLLATGELIGFIGLKDQDFDAPHTPAVDIGWRLRRQFWGKGYATEGARRCLAFAFETLGLQRVVSHCPAINTPSERVMHRIGMQKRGEFHHPLLSAFPELSRCVWYEAKNA